MIYLFVILAIYFSSDSQAYYQPAFNLRASTYLFGLDDVGGIYEFRGDISGTGAPARIRATFDLSKGRKIRKGSTNRRKTIPSKKSGQDNDNLVRNDDSDLFSLEKDVMKKFGTKQIKESALEKGNDELYAKPAPHKRNIRFEGFGSKPSPTATLAADSPRPRPRLIRFDDENGGDNINSKQQKSLSTSVSGRGKIGKINKPFFKDEVELASTLSEAIDDDFDLADFDLSDFDSSDDDSAEPVIASKSSLPSTSSRKPIVKTINSKLSASASLSSPTSPYKSKPSSPRRQYEGEEDDDEVSDFDSTPAALSTPQTTFRLRPPPVSVSSLLPSYTANTASEANTRGRNKKSVTKNPPPVANTRANTTAVSTEAGKEVKSDGEFFPFSFESGRADILSTHSQRLFSSSAATFEAIGVTSPGVLRNLEAMNIVQPTAVQAAAVPLLSRGDNDIVLQDASAACHH